MDESCFLPFPKKGNHTTQVSLPKLLKFIMPWFSTISDSKLRKFSGKIRTVFREIDPQFLRFWLFIKHWKKMNKKSGGNTFVCGFLQRDTLALFLFIICLNYKLWTSTDLLKRKWCHIKKDKKTIIFHRNYYWCRLCRWSKASCKYTCSN